MHAKNVAVSDVKDTNFWKQFTTFKACTKNTFPLFPMSKIQIFESNSQHPMFNSYLTTGCFRCQRYKFLKAIHNTSIEFHKRPYAVSDVKDTNFWKQFTTEVKCLTFNTMLFPMSKIQIFESNSQRNGHGTHVQKSCFRCQRYKFLKAIHNQNEACIYLVFAVSDVKDTNFWKQFTTILTYPNYFYMLFPMSKIQIFESNSQLPALNCSLRESCFRCQRYKFLKAIHNSPLLDILQTSAVSDVKDTNFWKQFTTISIYPGF